MKPSNKLLLHKIMMPFFASCCAILVCVFILGPIHFDLCQKGLILNGLGVIVAFLFALPQKNESEGLCRGVEGGTQVSECGESMPAERLESIYLNLTAWRKRWATLGLLLLLCGLGFQFTYQWQQNAASSLKVIPIDESDKSTAKTMEE